MTIRFRAGVLGVCIAFAGGSWTAAASTATGNVAVSATVLSYCLIAAAPLAFGTYSSNAALSATASVSVTCTSGTPYNVGLDPGAGAGAGGTVTARQMTFATHTLAYGIYQDSGQATVWGNTIGTNTEAGTGTGAPQSLTAYGQIPAGEYAAPGGYIDTVTATVTY